MVFNNLAAGNKIYNGGNSAATRGTVDPTGYIDRSLNAAPAPSYSRSGLASAAIQRVKNTPSVTAPGGTTYQAPVNSYQPMTADASGRITLNPLDLSDLDSSYNNAVGQAAQQRTSLDQQYSATSQDLESQKRDTQRNQIDDARGTLSNFAGRGMVFGSGYGQEVADQNQDYQNAYDSINTAGQQALQAHDTGIFNVNDGLTRFKGDIEGQRTARQTQFAGALHLQQQQEFANQQAAQAAANAALAASQQQHLGQQVVAPPAPLASGVPLASNINLKALNGSDKGFAPKAAPKAVVAAAKKKVAKK